MDDDPNPKKRKRPVKRDTNPRRAASMTVEAIRNIFADREYLMMGERIESLMSRNPHQLQNVDSLVANNPFDDSLQQSVTMPTNPPELPPRYIQSDLRPRRGFTQDQIGNMNHIRMHNPQQANHALPALTHMAQSYQSEYPLVGRARWVQNMRSICNSRMQRNLNNSQMMNPRMGRGSMNGSGLANRPSKNRVGGLAMNGSTMVSTTTESIKNPHASPRNEMIGNRVSPVNPTTTNVPILTRLLSRNHMNRAMNEPPIVYPQQYYDLMNNTQGPMQQPLSMPTRCPQVHCYEASDASMGSNEQANNTDMSRPFNDAPDINTMNGNSNNSMGACCSQYDKQDSIEVADHIISNAIKNFKSRNPTEQGMNMGMSTFQPDPQKTIPSITNSFESDNPTVQGMNMGMSTFQPDPQKTIPSNTNSFESDNPTVQGMNMGMSTFQPDPQKTIPSNTNSFESDNPTVQGMNMGMLTFQPDPQEAISSSINSFESDNPTGQGMNMGMSTFQDPQGTMNPQATYMPGGSEENIFSPNQPEDFDSQNEEVLCKFCKGLIVDINDQGIFCESGCNFWYHRHCIGMTPIAYELLMNESCAEWVCDNCYTTKDIPPVKYTL
ncbi:uncharacterized protein LOC100313527 [Nasonia vitripennis]|uniref:PHD-type domain-containing protein n=1 Tax=Nasonia vitripennis TaxID=7425 RepID=A0A7M6UFJ8_NASVI|nr:uncharacterized protein LOC100313527 [Nasonia vitripennis]